MSCTGSTDSSPTRSSSTISRCSVCSTADSRKKQKKKPKEKQEKKQVEEFQAGAFTKGAWGTGMKLKAAILQTRVFQDKERNIRQVEEILASGRTRDADLVTLPEMFCCPYETGNFPLYAEPEGGPSWQALSALAKRYGIYLSAGSMPEAETVRNPGPGQGTEMIRKPGAEQGTEMIRDLGLEKGAVADLSAKAGEAADSAGPGGESVTRIYNTAYVFDRQGRQIGKHRKAHLFDIAVEGGQHFRESDTLTPGGRIGCFDTEFGKVGLCVCYDFRFPETARLMAQDGAGIILVPAAFNMTTGPAHWELMFRQRAVESQCYVIGTAPARDPESSYLSWGHSIAVDPWGTVLTQMDEKEGIRVLELDLDYVEKVRRELPLLAHRRTDLYELRRID